MPKQKFLFTCLTMTLLLQAADISFAQVSRYEEPIRYRQAAMTMIKRHYTQLNNMANGKIPMNREELNRHANYLEMLSRVSLDGFVAGSHVGDTRAKADIWTDWSRFRSLNEKFVAEAVRVNGAARSNNLDALKIAVGDMAQICKNCHDDYRSNPIGQ